MNLFCGGIGLGRLVGDGTHTVVAWIALTLPVKYVAKLTADVLSRCSIEASARSNNKFYIFALWLRRFFIPFREHGDNLFPTFTGTEVFSMFTFWHGLLSLVLVFFGLRIEALPLSTVQGKCIYTLFKAENQDFQFSPLCTKLSIDEQKCFSFKGW